MEKTVKIQPKALNHNFIREKLKIKQQKGLNKFQELVGQKTSRKTGENCIFFHERGLEQKHGADWPLMKTRNNDANVTK